MVRLFFQHSSHKKLCVEALCVPFICDSLTSQNVSIAVKKFPELSSLKLADSHSCPNVDVDVLIGLDYYHSFFSGKIVKTVGGPTASENILGWVLSGHVSPDKPKLSFSNL